MVTLHHNGNIDKDSRINLVLQNQLNKIYLTVQAYTASKHIHCHSYFCHLRTPNKTKAQWRLFSYFILFLEACDQQQVTCAASWRINITSEQLQDSQTTGLSAHLTVFLSSSHQTHIIAKPLCNFLLQYWVHPPLNVQPHSRRKDLLMKLSVWTMSHWFQLHFLPRPC